MSQSTVQSYVPTVDATIVEAYRAADQSGKGKIRATTSKRMMAAVMDLKGELAADLGATLAALTTTKPVKETVDPRLVIAQRIADLVAAADMLSRGLVVPTDLTVEFSDEDFVGGHLVLPTVEADGTTASKIGAEKITRTEQRRSIQTVVDNAFDGLEDGAFLTVAEIRTRGQWEGYVPSDGAIAARLFPTDKSGNVRECTLDGVEPVEAVVGGEPRGARRVEA